MYSEYEKNEIVGRFLKHCEKIGFGEIKKVGVIEGLPVTIERPLQSIRFDKDLTDTPMNTTIDIDSTQHDNGE